MKILETIWKLVGFRRDGETRDDPLFGPLKWSTPLREWWGWRDRELRPTQTPFRCAADSVYLSVASQAMEMEDARGLFRRITADLQAVHQRLADEHLPGLNEHLWLDSPMTHEAFLSRFQLCSIAINRDGSVYVEFGDAFEDDILSGHGIGFIFHPDGNVEATGSG